jgi:hypothetical protein
MPPAFWETTENLSENEIPFVNTFQKPLISVTYVARHTEVSEKLPVYRGEWLHLNLTNGKT